MNSAAAVERAASTPSGARSPGRRDRRRRPRGTQYEPQRTARAASSGALGQQLAHGAGAPRAERSRVPSSRLPLAAPAGAGHVRARDRATRGHGRAEARRAARAGRCARFCSPCAPAAAAPSADPRARAAAPCGSPRPGAAPFRGARSRAHAAAQPADHLEPPAPRLVEHARRGVHQRLHRHRQAEVRAPGRIDAAGAARQHADDDDRRAVHEHGLAEHRALAAEFALPESVAEDARVNESAVLVVLGRQHSAKQRAGAERGEEVARDQLAVRQPRISAQRQVEAARLPEADELAEARRVPAQVGIDGMGERRCERRAARAPLRCRRTCGRTRPARPRATPGDAAPAGVTGSSLISTASAVLKSAVLAPIRCPGSRSSRRERPGVPSCRIAKRRSPRSSSSRPARATRGTPSL